jgi:hypothetical protein
VLGEAVTAAAPHRLAWLATIAAAIPDNGATADAFLAQATAAALNDDAEQAVDLVGQVRALLSPESTLAWVNRITPLANVTRTTLER